MKASKTELLFSKSFPKAAKLSPKRTLVIYDQMLASHPAFAKFLEQFPENYGVVSGEILKDLGRFYSHCEIILEKTNRLEARPLQILAVGGGSVGDFAGFVASVLKRGVGLIHMPSTWLAAVDSAHGGKTALNVKGMKNQIGTFYPAQQVYLVQELLSTQSEARAEEVLGEVLKMALLAGGSLYQKVFSLKKWDHKVLWSLLPLLIKEKYKVVTKDPLEQKGIRHLLNLGHTMGHVFESELSLPHGKAVLAGLGFALQWSLEKKVLNEKQFAKIQQSFLFRRIPWREQQADLLKKLNNPGSLLSQDKKRVGGKQIRFVFVKAPGKPSIMNVGLNEIENEVLRQSRP